jgi:hypothetical protein
MSNNILSKILPANPFSKDIGPSNLGQPIEQIRSNSELQTKLRDVKAGFEAKHQEIRAQGDAALRKNAGKSIGLQFLQPSLNPGVPPEMRQAMLENMDALTLSRARLASTDLCNDIDSNPALRRKIENSDDPSYKKLKDEVFKTF